ncbi:DUF4358 domain-containing protein [Ihubacter sp. rT4E-8]|uniref:DUF4358 domain-containing protein n=1 Tax=Ihubacter sp. rT4E-8 TaxID=3242369 RepID=UPI003CFB65ED
MIKKAVFVVILMIFLTSVYARAGAKDVPMEEIEKQLTAKCDMEQMAKCDNRNLMQFLGLDYEQYDSHLYYKGKEALSVDEVLIVKVHEKDDLDSVKDAVEKRVAVQTATFDGYGPEQVALLSDAVIFTKGKYLFYCTDKNAEDIGGVFSDAVQ